MRATVVARVELRCRRLSPHGIHLNEQDTKRRAVRGLMTTAAEGPGTRIRTESLIQTGPVRGTRGDGPAEENRSQVVGQCPAAVRVQPMRAFLFLFSWALVTGCAGVRSATSAPAASAGRINANGLFTAAASVGTATVTATSYADTSKQACTKVRVTPPYPSTLGGPVAAFPGAQGGGAGSVGGRGGTVCEVTNLNDSGPNSFRDCVSRSGPRTVVFRVGGTIQLLSQVTVSNPYITIAGQTAPGGGILFSGTRMPAGTMIFVATHDVVMRYIRIRVGVGAQHSGGPSNGVVGIAVMNYDIYNVMIDHVSESWWDNKPFIIYSNYGPGIHNVTVQWSMTNEGLAPSASRPGSQSVCGGSGASNTAPVNAAFHDDDYHHNFFSNCSHRVLETAQATMHYINNIHYNWSYFATETLGAQSSDIIGNLYKAGPLTTKNVCYLTGVGGRVCQGPAQPYEIKFSEGSSNLVGPPSVYMLGNKGPSQPNSAGDQWAMTNMIMSYQGPPAGPVPTSWRRGAPLPTQQNPITVDDVNHLEDILFPTVGASQRLDCSGSWVFNRDAVDTRLISEYKSGTGTIPTSETQVGGFPTIDPGKACADSDHDGIPDAWEIAHGLNPKNPSDGRKLNPDGYTNLEHFLNGGPPARTHHSGAE
jgi:pectate lyase